MVCPFICSQYPAIAVILFIENLEHPVLCCMMGYIQRGPHRCHVMFILQVFIRELISNCSDSLEKLRYLQMSTSELSDTDKDTPLEIHIAVDEEKKTFTIQVISRTI